MTYQLFFRANKTTFTLTQLILKRLQSEIKLSFLSLEKHFSNFIHIFIHTIIYNIDLVPNCSGLIILCKIINFYYINA